MIRRIRSLLCTAAWFVAVTPALAQRQMENLDRGVIVVRPVSGQAFIGWRLLGDDPKDVAFNVYRSSNGGAPVKVNGAPLTGATHFTDAPDFSNALTYSVRRVVDGAEFPADGSFSLSASPPVRSFLDVPLQRPEGGVSPDGTEYTYSANDASVGDLDGDGRLEIILRWEPSNSWGGGSGGHTGPVLLDAYKLDGTRLWRIDLGRNINASAHITVFLVYDFDGDGKSEIACMTADGSVDGAGQVIGDAEADHRNPNGVVLVGPEYLTVFDGETGAALSTTLFTPQRHPDTLYPTPAQIEAVWGDGYGNRVNRFLAGVAYLDGKRPSIVFSRGYYTRTVLAVWDWRGGELTSRWVFDSDDGTPGNAAYRGQGNHNLSVADVDHDGFDEIVYGSCTIDHDGKGLYSTGLHHGDALHVADMDPDRPGLEVFMPHESPGTNGGIGTSFRDARTGAVLWSTPASSDVGRGAAFDIDPAHPGFEAWASNSSSHFNARGEVIATTRPSTYNFGVWWDGAATRELLDGTRIDRWNPATLSMNRLLTGSGVSSNNGTKATPCLSGDIFGDWREEVIWRTSDNTALRIYTTSIPTDLRLTTLLHDPQYRVALAWQNGGYNQPPHPSFYLGHDMTAPPRAPVWREGLVWRGTSAEWNAADAWSDEAENPASFSNGDRVLFDLAGAAEAYVSITGNTQPGEVVVHAPETVDHTLDGTLSGAMPLTKAGHGRLTLAGVHSFTGGTHVQQGSLFVNGSLTASPVLVEGRATCGGGGTMGAGLTLRKHARLSPGPAPGEGGTLTVNGTLELADATIEFDLGETPDCISAGGPLVLSGMNTIAFSFPDGQPAPGSYPLMQIAGSITGGPGNFQAAGLGGTPASLELAGGTLSLVVAATRPPADVSWSGSGGDWDLDVSENWLLAGEPERFVTGDAVIFDDGGSAASFVTLAGELYPSSVSVEGAAPYTFGGSGVIAGSGGLSKSGDGLLVISGAHTFTGPVAISGGVVEISTLSLAGAPGPLGAGVEAIQISGGGVLRATGSFASTDRGFVAGPEGAVFEVAGNTANLVISGELSGSSPVVKKGPGTLTLSGVNVMSGGIVVESGTLAMGSSSSLGSGTVTLSGGSLAMNAFAPQNPIQVTADSTISGGSGGGSHGVKDISGSGTLTLVANQVFDLEGSLAGFSGRVVFGGSGSFRLFGSSGSAAADFDLGSRSVNPRSGTAFQFGSLGGAAGSVLGGAGGYTATVTHTVGANGNDSVFAGVIQDGSGPVHLVKTGAGTLTLSGDCTHTGSTTVSGGRLRIGGSTTGTTITVQSGATLGGSGTINGNAAFNNGAALEVSDAPLVVDGNVSFGDEVILRLPQGTALEAGTYTVLGYSGAMGGSPVFIWESPAGSMMEASVNTSMPGEIRLTLSMPTREPGEVTWTGANSMDWDTASANWLHGSDPAAFLTGDTVSFLDEGEGTSINLTLDVEPAAVNVAAGKSYTFAGAGIIAGPAALAKSGNGTLSLPGVHTYSGGSVVTGGVLAITQTGSGNSAVGGQAGTGPITLSQGAGFHMGSGNGRNFPGNAILVPQGESAVLSSANLANGYGGQISGGTDSLFTLSGPISMGRSGEAQFADFPGTVVIAAGGQLRFSSTSGPNGNGGADTHFRIDGMMNTRNSGGANGVVLGALSGGGTLQGQTNTPSGSVTYHVGAKNLSTVFSGTIADSTNGTVALHKTGDAVLTLSGNHTYTGATTVSAGGLMVDGSLGNTMVTVQSGAMLGGGGTLAGPVVCHGSVVPGSEGVGTLQVQGDLTFSASSTLEIELTSPDASDRLEIGGALVLDGVLNATDAGGAGAGTYTIASHAGNLTDNGLEIGSLPEGFTGSIETSGGTVRLVLIAVPTAFEQWQLDFFSSTSDPDAAPDADPDGDGTENEVEFRLGLDPRDGSSVYRAAGTITQDGFTITWPSAPGLSFEIRRSDSLDGDWELLETVTGQGTFTDVSPPPGRAFYRVILLP